MKLLLVLLSLTLGGCIHPKFQTCALSTSEGALQCFIPQDRNGADLKSIAFNSVSGGQVIAWTQRVQKSPKSPKIKKLDLSSSGIIQLSKGEN